MTVPGESVARAGVWRLTTDQHLLISFAQITEKRRQYNLRQVDIPTHYQNIFLRVFQEEPSKWSSCILANINHGNDAFIVELDQGFLAQSCVGQAPPVAMLV